MKKMLAAIEAGGTKFIAAVGDDPCQPLREIRVPTTTPEETFEAVIDFFRSCRSEGLDFEALGIGSFGPVDPQTRSRTWGFILDTPKKGWRDTAFAPFFQDRLAVPVAFDTDVNTAAWAEYVFSRQEEPDPLVYVTVGTGIGGGAVLEGRTLRGSLHPEMGHMRVKRHPADTFEGCCPFHGDCLEGLASGPAIEKRWKRTAQELAEGHPAWKMEAFYLAQGLLNLKFILSPRRIVLGGGVSRAPGLIPKVRRELSELAGGYLSQRLSPASIEALIVPASIPNPGLAGAFLMAEALLGTGSRDLSRSGSGR